MPERPQPRDIRRKRRRAGIGSLLAVLLAGACLFVANRISFGRLYARWDFSSSPGLSQRAGEVLDAASGELRIEAVFERDHPFRTPVRNLLREYEEAARSRPNLALRTRFLDLNQDVVESAALLREHPSAPPNSVFLTYGGRTVVLEEYDLAAPAPAGADGAGPGDGEAENAQPAFDGERACTAALLSLVRPVDDVVCFLTGHGEYNPDPGTEDPINGASAIAGDLLLNGYRVRTLSLASGAPVPDDCGVLVVAGPRSALAMREVEAIAEHLASGGRALLLLDDSRGNGLAPLLEAWGVRLEAPPPTPAARGAVPPAHAETYGAHPVTQRLANTITEFGNPCSVLPVETALAPERADKPAVTELAFVPRPAVAGADAGLRCIAVASELDGASLSGRRRSTRLVVVGDSEFVANGPLAQGFEGNSLLFVSAVNWLSGNDRPPAPTESSAALRAGIAPREGWLRLGLILAGAAPLCVLLVGLLPPLLFSNRR